MSNALNTRTTTAYPVPDAKMLATNLLYHKDNWSVSPKSNNFENYLKAETTAKEARRRDTSPKTANHHPWDKPQKGLEVRQPQDKPVVKEKQTVKEDNNHTDSESKMENASSKSKDSENDKADTTSDPKQPVDQSNPDSQAGSTDNSQIAQLLNPAFQVLADSNQLTELNASNQAVISAVTLDETAASLVKMPPNLVAPESVNNQLSQNITNPVVATSQPEGDSFAELIQQANSAQNATLQQVSVASLTQNPVNVQTAVSSNQTLVEAAAQTKKTANDSQKATVEPQVAVVTAPVADSKGSTHNSTGILNSSVLQDFQGKVTEQTATQNVSHNKDELQQSLSSVISGKTTLTSGESKPLNLALLQTQLAVNDGSDKTATIPVIQVQSPHVNSGQVPEMTGTGTRATGKDQLFGQIVENAKLMLAGNHSEMEMNLKPEHLGKLQLKVTIENQVVTASFVAESQQVKEIIETNLGQLRDHLRESGLKVDQLAVYVGTDANQQQFNQTSGNQGQFTTVKGSHSFDDDEVEALSATEKIASPKSLQETQIDLRA